MYGTCMRKHIKSIILGLGFHIHFFSGISQSIFSKLSFLTNVSYSMTELLSSLHRTRLLKNNNLRTYFIREHKKATSTKSAQGTDDRYLSKWPFYYCIYVISYFSFWRTLTKRPSTSSLDVRNICFTCVKIWTCLQLIFIYIA